MGEYLHSEVPNEATLLSLITCAKCKKLMEYPVELDCGHIFCRACLPVVNRPGDSPGLLIRQVSIVCVECGEFTPKKVECLPLAGWFQLMKEYLETSQRVERMTSSQQNSCCAFDDAVRIKWCRDCDLELCVQCAEQHVTLPRMKSHVIRDKSKASHQPRKMVCPDHSAQMDWLCGDCPRLLCLQCIHQGRCSDHNCERISKLVPQKEESLKGFLSHIQTEFDHLNDFRSALTKYETDKKQAFAENEEQVINSIAEKIEQLEQAKTKILGMIEEKRNDFNQTMESLYASIEDKFKEYEKLQDVIQTVSSPSQQIELVLACPLLRRRINVDQPSQYRLRDHISDFSLIYKDALIEEPQLTINSRPISPRRTPVLKGISFKANSFYGTIPQKDLSPNLKVKVERETKIPIKNKTKRKPDFFLCLPPPLPARSKSFDELDKAADHAEISPSIASSLDSGIELLTPEPFLFSSMMDDDEPVCKSIIEVPKKSERKRIDPSLLPAVLPQKPTTSESVFYVACPPIATCHIKTKGYATVHHSETECPLPPSDRPITWRSIPVQGGFEVLSLPNGRVLVTFENGVKVYDCDGNIVKSQTILGARGMAYRPMKRDILIAGYHSNTVYALHDSSFTFKADLKITMKKSMKPWSCAALSDGGFVVLYSREDKHLFLDFYDVEGKYMKTSECGFTAKGPVRMTTDVKDLIFISDESNNQVSICYHNENYLQPVIVGGKPCGMTSNPDGRGVFLANSTSISELKLSTRDGRFSDEKVIDLSVDVKSLAICNDNFICLTEADMRIISR